MPDDLKTPNLILLEIATGIAKLALKRQLPNPPDHAMRLICRGLELMASDPKITEAQIYRTIAEIGAALKAEQEEKPKRQTFRFRAAKIPLAEKL